MSDFKLLNENTATSNFIMLWIFPWCIHWLAQFFLAFEYQMLKGYSSFFEHINRSKQQKSEEEIYIFYILICSLPSLEQKIENFSCNLIGSHLFLNVNWYVNFLFMDWILNPLSVEVFLSAVVINYAHHHHWLFFQ